MLTPIIITLALILVVVLVILSVILIRAGNLPSQALSEVEADREQVREQAAADVDEGERLRAIALQRREHGYIPDAATQLERDTLVDGFAARMQLSGLAMPDSLRELLGYLTKDELEHLVDSWRT